MAQNQPAKTGPAKPEKWVLVELYTSEGCSSCPAADDLLRELESSQSLAGTHIVALGLHVDYWNRLGWKDVFSQKGFTERQHAYANRFNNRTVYTPQAVIQGEQELVGSDSRSLRAAISGSKATSGSIMHTQSGQEVMLTVQLPTAEAGHDVFVAEAESGLSSDVKRGENAGLMLQHASVVHKLAQVGHLQAGQKAGTFTYKPQQAAGGGRHWVAFVQEEGLGPVQAVAVW